MAKAMKKNARALSVSDCLVSLHIIFCLYLIVSEFETFRFKGSHALFWYSYFSRIFLLFCISMSQCLKRKISLASLPLGNAVSKRLKSGKNVSKTSQKIRCFRASETLSCLIESKKSSQKKKSSQFSIGLYGGFGNEMFLKLSQI